MRIAILVLPLLLSACGNAGSCVEDEYSCDGTVLSQCVDGEEVVQEDCADVGMACHAEMGHCMTMGMDSGM
jgi:hypothetical protein